MQEYTQIFLTAFLLNVILFVMHPDSLFTLVTSKKFIPVLIVIIIVFGIIFYVNADYSQDVQKQIIPSPTPVPVVWQTQSTTHSNYAIQYPADWTVGKNNVATDQVESFSYEERGNTYTFTVSPLGQSSGEASLLTVDTIEVTTRNYGGRNFLRKVWNYKNQPFLIQAQPNEEGFIFNSFSMQLPPTNTEKYISMFDQVLGRLHFSGDLQPPLTPVPTLEGENIIHVQ